MKLINQLLNTPRISLSVSNGCKRFFFVRSLERDLYIRWTFSRSLIIWSIETRQMCGTYSLCEWLRAIKNCVWLKLITNLVSKLVISSSLGITRNKSVDPRLVARTHMIVQIKMLIKDSDNRVRVHMGAESQSRNLSNYLHTGQVLVLYCCYCEYLHSTARFI